MSPCSRLAVAVFATLAAAATFSAGSLRADEAFEGRIREAGRALAEAGAVTGLDPDRQYRVVEYAMGNSAFALAHEFGHALIGEYRLPVLGREEDAADSFATLVFLQLGTDLGRAVLVDAARGLVRLADRQDRRGQVPALPGEHRVDRRRAYQILCLMVGSDREAFRTIAYEAGIPDERQETCRDDFDQAERSWLELLRAHLRTGGPRPTFAERLLRSVAGQPPPAEAAVTVAYREPVAGEEPLRAALRQVAMLERFAELFRRTFVLDRPIALEAGSCPDPNAFWDPAGRRVVLCYGLVADYLGLALEEVK